MPEGLVNMKISHFFLTFLISAVFSQLMSQDFNCMAIPVRHGSEILDHPFSGGLNSPQFNQMDIDLDGKEDLVVFDRITNDIQVFLYQNDKYVFDCSYDQLFPYVSAWMILKDYDADGLKDLFISPALSSAPSVQVFKAHVKEGKLQFEKRFFPYGTGDVISYKYFGFEYGVYVAKPDIPAVTDVDNDGDLDILSFESGGGTVNYYRNLCVDEGLSLDSFKMELADRCWGKFRESIYDDEIILSEDPLKCAESPGFRHAGSTILPIDMDGDSDTDLLLGDVSYNGLIYIHNGGSENDFATALERDFPQDDIPVQLNWFLGSFLVDVDQDSKKELVVAPNATIGSQNIDNILVYSDLDATSKFDFSLDPVQFMTKDMMDWGAKVFPCFVDENQDGLMDLIIGMSGMIGKDTSLDTRLVFYQNEGSTDSPVFSLKDTDYLGFSSRNESFLAPEFADLDGDLDIDLLIGLENGKFIYFENQGGPDMAFSFADPVYDFMNLDVGDNATPCLLDINNDGLMDLLSGNAMSFTNQNITGSLALFKNSGSKFNPYFEADWDADFNEVPFANVKLQESQFNTLSWATPEYYESKSGSELMVGSIKGTINQYAVSINDQLEILKDSVAGLDFGRFAAPAIADLDGNGFLDMLVGVETGGFRLYQTDIRALSTGTIQNTLGQNTFVISPNPAANKISISQLGRRTENNEWVQITIMDQLGNIKLQYDKYTLNTALDLSGLPSGIYFVLIQEDVFMSFNRFMKY